jgi:predicted ATPase/class 3 adenylate cyclase/tRNA A-37 threonylcarbamoyl transferase component Bud32
VTIASVEGGLVGALVAGRYQVLEQLGKGGMGAVYVAEQQPLERKVALKVLRGRHHHDAEARERFVREARAASRLNHPNIATVYDFGTAEDGPFLAMELVEGVTLKQKMIRPLPWRRAISLVTQIARGLAAAHCHGIVHRDIKPANIIVSESGDGEWVKILDFGLANMTEEESVELTDQGVVMGTAAYMSPEQCHGVKNDVRSDLYALGVVLFEMLAGRRPFLGGTPTELVIAHATEPPPKLADVTEDVPAAVCALVDRLLSKNPDERPDDGAVLVQALDAIVREIDEADVSAGLSWLPPDRDDAPLGKVTVVFTDIEGSSQLWDRAPKAMRAALDLHDAVMREALRKTGGYEVKTQGDSFMVAFSDELTAIAWALEVQRALVDQPWPAEVSIGADERAAGDDDRARVPGLRVRMGMHVGEPDCRRDPVTGRMDYFGPVVNRAARIESAAHGGQILVGSAVALAIGDGLPPLSAATASRGEHRLKGLDETEELFEVVDESGPQRTFPPPRAQADTERTNLPTLEHTVFVGRAREREAIAERLRSASRLVTLLGPGGTGKTRLSRTIARDALEAGDVDEAWFCELANATDAMELTAAVASALSVPLGGEEAAEDAIELVGRALERRGKVLLVADNLEQVVAAGPATVGVWLELAPELRCVATSREPLGVDGEERFELDPLDTDHGAELFAARVKELGRPPPDDDEAVRELVTALDGMPLAIELAASRAGLMSPRQLVDRLGRRFDLLRGSRRDVSARQATLRGAIDWSWELLSPVEQDAFAQLAAFEGGFSIEAAEEIVDLSAHDGAPFVLDVVQALKEKSLLRTEPVEDHELRLTMLQSIHDYATEKLERSEDGGEGVFQRHAAFFVREGRRKSRETTNRGGRDAMRWLDRNRQNLRAVTARLRDVEPALAVRASLNLMPLLQERDPTSSCCCVIDEAIDIARGVEDDDALLADALLYRADIEQERGNALNALAMIDEAIELVGDTPLRAVALVWRCRALNRLGRLEEGVEALDEAEPLARKAGMNTIVARILMQRGLQAISSADLQTAYFADALKLARRVGSRGLEARILGNMGVERMLRSEPEAARQAHEAALALHRENGDRGLEGMTLGNLGAAALARREPEEAERLLRSAVAIHRQVGNELLVGADMGNLAIALLDQSRFRDAISIGEDALERILKTKGARELMLCQHVLASAYAAVDEVDKARASLDEGQAVHAPYWRAALPNYLALVDAQVKLAAARRDGVAPDDPRVEEVRESLERLGRDHDQLFMRLDALEHALERYPAPPVDRSTGDVSA